MDLTIDKTVGNKLKTNDEIKMFTKELNEFLENNHSNSFNTTICNEIYQEIPLASKYKDKIENLVNKYMTELSYDRQFFYFDYDKNEDKFYLDYYYDAGKKERIEVLKDEIEGFEKGNFYYIFDDERFVRTESLQENIKINVESDLESMEFKNNKLKGKNNEI